MTVQVHRAKQCRPRKGGFLRRSPTFSSTSVFFGHLVLHNTYDDEDLPYIYIPYIYESFSDVGEIRVYFASKILTPCRMH